MARQDYPGNIKDNFRNRQDNLIALQGNIKSNKDRQEGRKGLKTGRQEWRRAIQEKMKSLKGWWADRQDMSQGVQDRFRLVG